MPEKNQALRNESCMGIAASGSLCHLPNRDSRTLNQCFCITILGAELTDRHLTGVQAKCGAPFASLFFFNVVAFGTAPPACG